MRSSFPPKTLLFLLVFAAALLGLGIWQISKTEVGAVKLLGFQDADVPFELENGMEIDGRFHMLSAWDSLAVPIANSMEMPMGTENGGLVYNAQKFWEMNNKRGGHHTGDDLNGIGGMNTDLGDPVYAIADGLVIYSGEPSPGWGKMVILAHRQEDGSLLQSLYAHLNRIEAAVGEMIPRGDRIGEVGTANGFYPAHLHLEMHTGSGVYIGGGYTSAPLDRIDPVALIGRFNHSGPLGIVPNMLPMAVKDLAKNWTQLEIGNAEILTDLER